MISGCLKAVSQSLKNPALSYRINRFFLSMHQLFRIRNFCRQKPHRLPDVPDRSQEIGSLPTKYLIASMQIPASDGFPGPGEMIRASGLIASISSDCIFIVSNNLYIRFYRTDQLIYVVGKTVIIINQYDHSNPSCDIFDCQNYGSCLIAALFKFFFRNTVCHDSCTGADADLTFFLIYKTDSNAGIKVSGKIKISNRAAINASFALFQFFDDLAGPEFRCSGKSSCR